MSRPFLSRLAALSGALAIAVAAWSPGPAQAQRAPLTGQTAHGVPLASDVIPIQPAAGATLLKSTAADIQNFVLTSVKAYGAGGDGVTGDTAALQAAINSGSALTCNGTI